MTSSSKPDIWVMGCGYVGQPLAAALEEAGWSVRAFTRTESSADALALPPSIPVAACDISSPSAVQELGQRLPSPDGLIHCASSGRGREDRYQAVYLDGCAHLLDAFPDAQLLFTSSTSVYPQTEGETVTEDSRASPSSATAQILRQAEDLVLEQGGIVARLSGIYGPGRSIYLRRFLSGTARIERGTSRLLNQIHRDDIVSALLTLLRRRNEAAGQIYNVSDGALLTQRSCLEGLAEFFGKPLPLEADPNPEVKRAWTHKRVDSSKLQALGWSPTYPDFLQALQLDPELISSIESQVS